MRAAADIMDLSSYGLDPTVIELEQVGMALTGQPAAYFMPSTTAAALCVLLAMDVRGKQILMEHRSHVWWMQRLHHTVHGGGAPILLEGDKSGAIPIDTLRRALTRSVAGLRLDTAAVCLENTHNVCGGTVLTPDYTKQVAEIAHENGASLFIDGARIFNSAVAQGIPVRALTSAADAVAISLNKVVGAPYGALLCGTQDLIYRARTEAARIGANQIHKSGIFAAAALVGLGDVQVRAAADHTRLRRLAAGLHEVPGIRIDLDTVQTNLLRINVEDLGISARDFVALMRERGIGVKESEPSAVRAVAYGGVTDRDVDEAIEIIRVAANDLLDARSGAARSAEAGRTFRNSTAL